MKVLKTAGKVLLAILLILVVLIAGLLIWLTVVEYKPSDKENADVTALSAESGELLKQGDQIKLVAWNMGYGALGDNADFFMDGIHC